MKILIIEDEYAAAKRLTQLLTEIRPEWEIVAVLESVEEANDWFRKNIQPDLVFSDIQLADGVAFEIYSKIELKCPVIFTTAYDNYAIQAFKLNSIDYLLKPIVTEHLFNAIKKYENMRFESGQAEKLIKLAESYLTKQVETSDRLLVRLGQKLRAIETREMAYFYIDGRTVILQAVDGSRYPVDETLDQLEASLNARDFFRVNRQMIVRFGSIKDMVVYSKSRIKLVLEPPFNDDVIVSGNRSAQFKDWLKGASA